VVFLEQHRETARRTRVAAPDQTSTASPSPCRPDGPAGGAGDVDPFEEKTEPPETAGSEPDALPPNVQSVDLGQQHSTYTPKKQAVFLEDYYGEDFVEELSKKSRRGRGVTS